MFFTFSAGKTRLSELIKNFSFSEAAFVLTQKNSDKFFAIILENQPEYILGVGIYSGIDQEKIRIEQFCTNKFRNNLLGSNKLIKLQIPYFLMEDKCFKLADGIGNSYCNLLSYKITSFLSQENLSTRFTFLHIPKSWDKTRVEDVINEKICYDKSIEKYTFS